MDEQQRNTIENERQRLISQKRDIEVKLTLVEDWRRQETSNILMRRLSKTESIEATVNLEANARKKKAPLIREKQAIEKRLHDLKNRLRTCESDGNQLGTLRRIEVLVATLVDHIVKHQK